MMPITKSKTNREPPMLAANTRGWLLPPLLPPLLAVLVRFSGTKSVGLAEEEGGEGNGDWGTEGAGSGAGIGGVGAGAGSGATTGSVINGGSISRGGVGGIWNLKGGIFLLGASCNNFRSPTSLFSQGVLQRLWISWNWKARYYSVNNDSNAFKRQNEEFIWN